MPDLSPSSYTPPENISGDTLVIRGDEYVHLSRVLRKNPGDRLRVVDGCGMEYTADVSRVERGSITCTIRERRTCEIEPAANLTLAVGLLKNVSRFEVLVEKSTELGAAAIVPLTTERTVAFHDRGNRWTRIAVSAMIQSGRAVLPRISGVTPLDAFLGAAPPEALRLIAHERATGPLLAEVPARAQTVVCIGPEGGFSEAELGRAVAAGFQPVSLGARRLRTETAGIVAAALILSRLPG